MESVQALLLVLVTVASLCPAIAVEVQVLPDLASDCSSSSDNSGDTLSAVNIDTALMNTRSNTTLLLENGCYHINSFTLLQDLSNISLIGSGSETTIVKCQGDVGLAFVNISGLLISDVTITNCRLSGENLQNAFDLVKESVSVGNIFLGIGIFIVDINNMKVKNVVVQNSPWTGMVAINLMGESYMNNVFFKNNGIFGNTLLRVGGGLYIHYADYYNYIPTILPKLTISSSMFKWNYNTFYFGGGFGIGLTQIKFPVNIKIVSATSESNISPQGAGAAVTYYKGISNNSVTISSSIFQKNRADGTGGGLAVTLNFNNYYNLDVTPNEILSNTVNVENTVIAENRAASFAGVAISSLNSQLTTKNNQNHVIFKSCMFLKNRSPIGAAFGALSTVFSGSDPEVSITFDTVIVQGNDASSFSDEEKLQAGITEETSVAALSSVNLFVKGKSQFINNMGSALLLTRSIVTIEGNVSFSNNSGSGIILLVASSIILQTNSILSFVKNRATSRGGAIFADFRTFVDLSSINDCFLLLGNNVNINNITLVFEDNQAPLGGTIYGSILQDCPWNNRARPSSGVTFLQQLPSVTFKPPPNNYSVVSTDSYSLSMDISQPISAVPGKKFHMNITALDRFGHTVPTPISSAYQDMTAPRLQLGLSGYWFLIPDHPVQLTFYGESGNKLNTFITVVDSYARVSLSVTFENCPYGFINQNLTCVCHTPSIGDINVCDQDNFQLQIPPNVWLGNSSTGEFAYASCILDYCEVGTKIISDGDIDSQCEPEYNRVGLLCASCKSNMSIVFGSNACRPCSSAYLASIIMYGVLGIVLVLAISFLGFSISEGYLNSLLFYCNVASFYSSFFAPNYSMAFLLVKLVNLSMGFKLCFYDGMDTLAKVGIQLLFPAYLFFIMLVIIILAKYSSKISNAGFSAAKTFSTLLLLCYTSVGETCILILAWKRFDHGLNGTYWYADPTIQYGHEVHGLLVFVAVILILVYILPFSIGLLLPPLILRTRLSIMLKPLLDAFWNPFKPKFRFWIGLRAVLRILPFCFAVLIPPPDNSFWLAIFLAALLLFHGHFQPFEGKRQNFLDLFFYLNLLLLAVGTVFFSPTPSNNSNRYNIAFVSVLLALAYLIFLIIVALHINIHFPVIRNTAINHFYWLKQNLKKERKSNDMKDDHNDPGAAQSQVPMTTFSELREPFLDYEEDEFL